MALVDLIQIYRDVFSKKVAHCAMCYKSQAETRLLHSRVYQKVVETLNYSDLLTQSNQLCYMCESRMRSFMRLVDNLQLALEVQRVFIRADKCTKYRGLKNSLCSFRLPLRLYIYDRFHQEPFSSLDGQTPSKIHPSKLMHLLYQSDYLQKNVMEKSLNLYQSKFVKFRKRMQLYKTNILIVDSLEIPGQTPPTPPDPIITSPPLTIPEIEKNDTESLENIKNEKNVSTQINTVELPMIIPNSNVVLTLGPDNNLYMVPTITVVDSNVNHNIALIPEQVTNIQENWNEQTQIPTDPKNTNDSVNSARKRSQEDKKMVTKKKKCTLPLIIDCRTDNTAFGENINVSGGVPGDTCDIQVPEVVKHPIRTDTEVDWEDKIPMEVISFADDEPTSRRKNRYLKGDSKIT